MASNAAKECPICQDEYNEEEKCPRGLPCSHTLCSECLQNLIIRNSKTCPFCIRQFTAESARDVAVNRGLLDLLKYVKEMEMRSPAPPENPAAARSDRMHDLRRGTDEVIDRLLGSFKRTDEEIDRQLQSNTELVTCLSGAKNVIVNEIQPCINELLSQNASTTSYVEEHSKRLKKQKMTIEEARKAVTGAKTKLKSAKTFGQIGTTADEVESISTDAGSRLQDFMEQLKEDEKTHFTLEQVAKSTKREVVKLKDAVNAMRGSEELRCIPDLQQMKISKDLKILNSIPQPVTVEGLRSRSESVMDLLRQGLLFAVQELVGRRTYAQISLQEKNRICLHCLKEQTIPANAHILQHSDILSLMDASSRLVFLQLSVAGEDKILGKMFIRLSPDSKRAQQFAMLCSGEKMVSYVNSNILCISNKNNQWESVSMGDYENKGGSGGRGLINGVQREEGGVFTRPRTAGTIMGMCPLTSDLYASQFLIFTRGHPKQTADYCFGIVEEGLPILHKTIRSYEDITKVTVSDAGLVLPF